MAAEWGGVWREESLLSIHQQPWCSLQVHRHLSPAREGRFHPTEGKGTANNTAAPSTLPLLTEVCAFLLSHPIFLSGLILSSECDSKCPSFAQGRPTSGPKPPVLPAVTITDQ